ncbi:DDE_3 domain-containing protein [Trichonephila clavipes]|nr:DDE_3 domain-containing protein [Trichonephila clavipes]
MAFALQRSTIEEQRSVIRFLTAEGRESVGDDQRPGQANTVITSDLIDKVDDLVRSDRRVTLRMRMDASYGPVWTIVHNRLRFRKVHQEQETGTAHGEGVVLLHDNVRPHISIATQMELDKFKSETLDHPPYSPDISPLRFPCVWSTEETPEREAFQLGRRTQGHCKGLGLVTAAGILGTKGILRLAYQWDRCAQAYSVYF